MSKSFSGRHYGPNKTDNNGHKPLTPMFTSPKHLCTYPQFGCATKPPPGYAPCTRMAGHDGPCAMDFAPTIIGVAEKFFLEVRETCRKLAEEHGLNPEQVVPDYMVLPWRLYWGWVFGQYSTYYPFFYSNTRTRVYLNIFRVRPKIHWTIDTSGWEGLV